MTSFFGELRRRNVVRVAVAYAIVGWILVEVSSTVFPILQLPDWTVILVTMLLILGFPVALILSWAYDLTPQGVVRADQVPLSEGITKVTGRKFDFVIIGLLVLAVGFMFVDNYLPESGPFAGAEIDPASLEVELDEPPSIAVKAAPAIEEEAQRDVLPNSVAVLVCENLSPDPLLGLRPHSSRGSASRSDSSLGRHHQGHGAEVRLRDYRAAGVGSWIHVRRQLST